MFDGKTYEDRLDRERLGSLLDRVRLLMVDGHWRTLQEIQRAVGGTEASVSARLRDLRKPRFGGWNVQRKRVGADGLHVYRIDTK